MAETSYLQQYLNRFNNGGSADMVTASAYANGSTNGSGDMSAAFEDLYKKKQLQANAVSWLSREDGNIYLTTVDDGVPHFDIKVMNGNAYVEGKQTLRTASAKPGTVSTTELDKAMYSAFTPEFQDKFAEYNSAILKTAGVITSKDFLGITTTVVQGELLDLDKRNYVLPQAVSTIQTDELEFQIDSYNRFQVAEDVGELELTPERAGQITSQTFGLKKDQGHIAWTQTFSQRTRRHNMLQLHARNVADDFERVTSERIATKLISFTDISAAGGWNTINTTYGRSTNDPTNDISAAMATIRNNGGVANRAASNNAAYQVYAKNDFIKGAGTAVGNVAVGEGVYGNPPALPGFTWYVDELLPAASVFIYDVNGIVHIVGPRRTANYSRPELEISGIVINNFDNTVIRTAGFGRQIITMVV